MSEQQIAAILSALAIAISTWNLIWLLWLRKRRRRRP